MRAGRIPDLKRVVLLREVDRDLVSPRHMRHAPNRADLDTTALLRPLRAPDDIKRPALRALSCLPEPEPQKVLVRGQPLTRCVV